MNLVQILKRGKIYTYSNLLSLSRIFLGFIVYLLIIDRNTLGALIIAVLAIITDYLDGYLARKRDEISELGKILDPLADKVAIAFAALALYQSYDLPFWILFIIIGRDILILFGSTLLIGKVKSVVASELPGKVAATVISLLILIYILQLNFFKNIFLLLTAITVIFSFFFYTLKFIKIFLNSRFEKE